MVRSHLVHTAYESEEEGKALSQDDSEVLECHIPHLRHNMLIGHCVLSADPSSVVTFFFNTQNKNKIKNFFLLVKEWTDAGVKSCSVFWGAQ